LSIQISKPTLRLLKMGDRCHSHGYFEPELERLRRRVAELEDKNRRLAEENASSKNSDDLYRILVEYSRDLLWCFDLRTMSYRYISPSIERLSGFTPDEVMAMRLEDHMTPESFKKVTAMFEEGFRRLAAGDPDPTPVDEMEFVMYRKDGSLVNVGMTASLHLDQDGQPAYLVGVTRDITDRVRAKEALEEKVQERTRALQAALADLAEREKSYRSLFYNAPVPACSWKKQGDDFVMTDCNRAAEISTDGLVNEVKQGVSVDLFDNQKDFMDEIARCYREQSVFQSDKIYTFTAKGSDREMEKSFAFVPPDTVLTYGQDVTERNQAQRALAKSEAMFRALTETTASGIFIARGHKPLYANKAARAIFDLTKDEIKKISKWSAIDFVDPEARELVKKRGLARERGENVPDRYEIKVRTPSGKTKWIDLSAQRIEYEGNSAILGTFFDITERKHTEDALRESEERYRSLVENIPLAICIARDGTIEYANNAAARVIGVESPEALRGRKMLGLNQDERIESAMASYNWALSGSDQPPVEYSFRRPDGQEVVLETMAYPYRYQGAPAVLVVGHDVTERRLAQRELEEYQKRLRTMTSELATVEERERRRIAVDLHDRVGQTLAICTTRVKFLREALAGSPNSDEINGILKMLHQTIQDTRALTFELSPPLLYELGLASAVEWLAEHVQEHYGLEVQFKDDGLPKPLKEDLKILLFRSTRELLINTVKHARAGWARVSLSTDGRRISVNVEDNGVGLMEDIMETRAAKGFGLFSIRERLEPLGGTLEIRSQPHQGKPSYPDGAAGF
jgi:PAS domain S-box-containing protein